MKGPDKNTSDRLLQKYMLGQPLTGTDYRTLRAAGYIAPAGNGWVLTDAGRKRWAKDD